MNPLTWPRRVLLIGGVAIVLAVAVTIGVLLHQRNAARDAAHAAGLVAENEKAKADTTRLLRDRDRAALAKVYGDSVIAVQRLAVQAALQRDALSRQLGTVAHAVSVLTATVDVLRVASESTGPTVEDSAGTRRASFDVRRVPYTVHADVALPRAGAGRLDSLVVALDAATLVPRLECGPANAFGVRPAQIVVVTPPWLRTTVERATLDPGVCNPDPPPRPRRWSLGVTAGYGVTYARDDHKVYDGPSATAGLSFRVF